MQTRLLSPDSLWIEMPLSPRTCRLVWHAMASCGLVKGKINSYKEEHFSPLYDWQQHLVEGRTIAGFFARDNVRVQAQLTAENGGTRLDFYAVHPKGGIDFGASKRFQRRLVPLIEECVRDMAVDWEVPEIQKETVAPIASPTEFSVSSMPTLPEFAVVVPISEGHLSAKQRMRIWGFLAGGLVVLYFAARWHVIGIVFLGIAGWVLWNGRRTRKTDWVSFVLFTGVGLLQCWQVVTGWF